MKESVLVYLYSYRVATLDNASHTRDNEDSLSIVAYPRRGFASLFCKCPISLERIRATAICYTKDILTINFLISHQT